jgi:pimeloyl-ACP methyl ester carboxylesterase
VQNVTPTWGVTHAPAGTGRTMDVRAARPHSSATAPRARTGAGARVLATAGVLSRARAQPDPAAVPDPTEPPSVRTGLAELGSGLAAIRLVGATPRLLSVPRGDGHTVVDIPGWKAPELSGAPLRAYLRALGYDARGWGFGTNTGDPRRDVERLTRQVLHRVGASGSPVSLVGWSLGGVIAREVARREPGAIRQVITYGTPVVGGARFTAVARAYGAADSSAADAVAKRLDAESPISVPLTAVFTKRDGIVAWQACIDHRTPRAEHVEVASTHIGMGLDPDVWELIARRLARNVN